jgi:two-component system nitrogen regulation response regulator GlnG
MSAPSGLSILLVDDEIELLGEIERFLTRRGHRVRTASSFDDGQRLIDDADAVDVLITDVRMPGGSGLTLAQRVQAFHAQCRVIVMTGHLDQNQIGTAADLGAAAVLFKPFSFSKLLALVKGESSTAMALPVRGPDVASIAPETA